MLLIFRGIAFATVGLCLKSGWEAQSMLRAISHVVRSLIAGESS